MTEDPCSTHAAQQIEVDSVVKKPGQIHRHSAGSIGCVTEDRSTRDVTAGS